MEPRTQSNGAGHRDEPWPGPGPSGFGPAAPFPREDVDGYQFHQLVRRTPAADVYLAHHRATRADREVIVVQRLPAVDGTALRRAVEHQASAARAVDHAGVLAVEHVGLTRDGRMYVATARPVGFSLRKVLAEWGTPSGPRALGLGLEIADAVAAAHDVGLVHGRLIPDNVVLIPQPAGLPDRVAVCGFGTAPVQDATLMPGAVPDDQRPFVSPERAVGGPPSVRDDVFALGSLVLTICTGAPPPPLRADDGQPGPDRGDTRLGAIGRVLRRARDPEAGRRYASARDFAAALRQARDVPATRTPTAYTPAAGGGVGDWARGPRQALITAAAVGAVAVVGGRVWRDHAAAVSRSPLDQTAQVREPAAPVHEVVPVAPPTETSRPVRAPAAVRTPNVDSTSDIPSRAPAPVPPRALPPARPVTAAKTPPAPGGRGAWPAGGPAISAAADGAVAVTGSAAGDIITAGPSDAGASAASTGTPSTTPNTSAGGAIPEDRSAAGVHAAVSEYGTAVESRDLERLTRVYPGMTESQRRAWSTFFGSVSGLRARLVVDQITVAGPTARVRVRGTYDYENLRPRRAEHAPVSFTATLVRDGPGWRVRAVE